MHFVRKLGENDVKTKPWSSAVMKYVIRRLDDICVEKMFALTKNQLPWKNKDLELLSFKMFLFTPPLDLCFKRII